MQVKLEKEKYLAACQRCGYEFTQDWFSDNVANWQRAFQSLAGQTGLHFLEIGCWEGRATCWLLDHVLTHETSRITCIDTFRGGFEHTELAQDIPSTEARFDGNVQRTGVADRVQKLVGRSQILLRQLPLNEFHALYIDGSHFASDVLEDAVLAWRTVRSDGLIIFDDYQWPHYLDQPTKRPQLAIDAFLSVFRDQLVVLFKGYQVFLRKTAPRSP